MPFPFNVYLCALLSAGAAAALSMPFWRRWCQRTGTMDDPGHRKIHSQPIALAGGLAVMTGLMVPLLIGAFLVEFKSGSMIKPLVHTVVTTNTAELFHYGFGRRAVELVGIIVGAFGMLLLGLWDDKTELRPAIKFGGQLLVALMVAACGVRITLFVPNLLFSYFITVLWILTVVNAFNFMDNMNGLCAGLGAVGAWYFGVASAVQGEYLVATIAFLVTGGLIGFLPSNFPKATAFLGDAGSHLVGFLMAVLGILPHFYTKQNPQCLAVLTPMVILAIPLADMAWVVVLRWRIGQPFYVGDNNHLSHRLVRAGFTPQRAVLIIWAMAAAIGALAFV